MSETLKKFSSSGLVHKNRHHIIHEMANKVEFSYGKCKSISDAKSDHVRDLHQIHVSSD
jgi:hypothetical protein